MRAWKPGEDKTIVVGAGHVPEIKFFLENPCTDKEIINLVSSHVELLESNPKKYMQIKKSHEERIVRKELQGVTTLGLLVAGITVGSEVLRYMITSS